jgi:hypothetical protein
MRPLRLVCLLAILLSPMALAQQNSVPLINHGAKVVSPPGWVHSPKSKEAFQSLELAHDKFPLANPQANLLFSFLQEYGSGECVADSVAVADVNGDGKPDLVVVNEFGPNAVVGCSSGPFTSPSPTIGVLLGNGDGTFQPAVTYDSGGLDTYSVAVADVNGDGKPDLVVVNNCADSSCVNGNVGVLLGNGDGTFQPAVTYDSGGLDTYSVAVADVNGDGKPDLVVANYCTDSGCLNGNAGVLLGNGDGTFQAAVSYLSGGQYADSVAVADVNGDGKPDLLVANGCAFNQTLCANGSAGVLLGNGDGTFQAAVSYLSPGQFALSLVVGDVNQDGIPDLLLYNSSLYTFGGYDGLVNLLLGNSDGTFQPATSYLFGGNCCSGQNPHGEALALGDVNGDGKPDLVVTSKCYGYPGDQISCLNGTADGSVGVFLNVSPSPAVTFSPISLTFPDQVAFTISPAQLVTLTNTGAAVLTISGISVSGPFSQTNNCPSNLNPNAYCSINIKFHPKSKGIFHGSVSVTDNASGSPQKVPLTGTGTFVQLVPTKLNFGTQPVGTRSLAKKITLTNKGNSAVKISSLAITGADAGDFAETNTCGESVASGASCFIKVTFKPLAKGKLTANVSVYDNGGGSPQEVSLIGTGT